MTELPNVKRLICSPPQTGVTISLWSPRFRELFGAFFLAELPRDWDGKYWPPLQVLVAALTSSSSIAQINPPYGLTMNGKWGIVICLSTQSQELNTLSLGVTKIMLKVLVRVLVWGMAEIRETRINLAAKTRNNSLNKLNHMWHQYWEENPEVTARCDCSKIY